MYDLAKRSLVFTVATGGLLLTGSAFSPAMAATGLGTAQGPAQAHETGSALSASQALRAATASGSGEAAENSAPERGAAQPPDLLFPQSASGAGGSAAASHTVDPGAALARDPFHLPIDLGRQLCDSVRDEFSPGPAADGACRTDAGPREKARTPAHSARLGCDGAVAEDVVNADERRATCATAEGSASTLPDESAAGSDGASATAPSRGFAHMPVGVPVSMPMMRGGLPTACDDAMAADDPAVQARDDEDARADDPCGAPHVGRHRYPGAQPTCTPPPPKCPPSAPPVKTTPPPPRAVTTATPPRELPHTGADIDVALGVAGAALLAGLGLSGASRRRQRGH